MRITITLLTFFFFHLSVQAQLTPHVPGEILVQMQAGRDASVWAQTPVEKAKAGYSCIRAVVPVAEALHIWKVQFDPTCTPEAQLLERLRQDPAIVLAQFNHYVELRGTTPNDPLFSQQWQWYNRGQNGGIRGLDIGLQQAWEMSTGGVTTNGDSIVVAVIDTGIDTAHADLRPNLWRNRAEIPNNQQDDDLNGYVDDYRGWNSQTFNGDVNETNFGGHGTGVAGIIGAKGNNGIDGSGVNWNVKIMPLVWGASGTEEVILRAFNYVYVQRRLYNESKGAKGAYVVAINASWGLPGLRSDQYPIWCPFFDGLGAQGILSVNAASNRLENMDETGDIPSGCSSPYLIAVTSLDQRGQLERGYGPNSIDLAAFGEEVLSVRLREGFRSFSGTSFAAPQVTGALALLYASPCAELADLAKSSPGEAALLARRLILDGAQSLADLQGKVVTGGYLRVDKSMKLLSAFCSQTVQAKPQLLSYPNPFHEQLLVPIRSTQAIEQGLLEVFNLQGQKMYDQRVDVPAGFPALVEIEAGAWPVGMYVLRLRWGGSEMVVEKVLKM